MTRYLPRLLLVLLCILCAAPAFAQNKEISESDKAIFAFFKLGGGVPDFEKWVKNSQRYKNTPSGSQENILTIEMLRLQYGFGTYDAAQDFIKIRTPVKLLLHGEPGEEMLSFMFPNAGEHNVPYFPFQYGTEWIALVVTDLGDFLNTTLSPEDLKIVSAKLEPNKVYNGEITFHARALQADTSQPLPLDGMEQWLMMGDTGKIELAARSGGQEVRIWSWTAPWYLTNTEKELFPLLEH